MFVSTVPSDGLMVESIHPVSMGTPTCHSHTDISMFTVTHKHKMYGEQPTQTWRRWSFRQNFKLILMRNHGKMNTAAASILDSKNLLALVWPKTGINLAKRSQIRLAKITPKGGQTSPKRIMDFWNISCYKHVILLLILVSPDDGDLRTVWWGGSKHSVVVLVGGVSGVFMARLNQTFNKITIQAAAKARFYG